MKAAAAPVLVHVLPLPYPHILLPENRLAFSVSREIGDGLLALIEEREEDERHASRKRKDRTFLIAAVPVLPSPSLDSQTRLSEWGTAVRVVRLVKSPASNQLDGQATFKTGRGPSTGYLVSLQGLSRVKVVGPADGTPNSYPSLPLHTITFASPDSEQLKPESLIKFKRAALGLLDKLVRDSVQRAKREAYSRLIDMLEDLDVHSPSTESVSRAAWMADVLVGNVVSDYNDKLAVLCTLSPSNAIFALSSQIFTKQISIMDVSNKVASAVDESLSRAQKQYFLKQQLEAIQRELLNLQRQNLGNSNHTSSPANGVYEGFGFGSGTSNSSDLDAEDDPSLDPSEDVALKRKIEALAPGSEERNIATREWKRLKRIPPGSVETGVIRSYLEWLTSIPWSSSAERLPPSSSLTLSDARTQLDADHFGLDKIKKRLVEFLAVVRLREWQMSTTTKENGSKVKEKDDKEVVVYDKKSQPQQANLHSQAKTKALKGPILLFVGPPGTGKTSLGQSIARALGRPFQRIALGGVRDEAEIRGHRRTYVASGPGLIVQALRKMGRGDGVLLLDEIDKIGHISFHGDPAAALLEALDPEQNHAFNDHYINVPIDLSQLLFICTANTLETISLPLLDRCEVIYLSGYTPNEKLSIANRFLLPKQLEANGMNLEQVQITDAAMVEIVNRYSRGEAGVRGLERKIGSVIRFKVVEWSDWREHQKKGDGPLAYNPIVDEADMEGILGIAPWDAIHDEVGLAGRVRDSRAGVVYGLVVMGQGEGGILPVETVMVPGEGKLKLTGLLGDVIKESAELALSWVKTNAYDLGITTARSEDPLKATRSVDIHLHLPAGAQKKDGPSAGIAMVCALISLLTSLSVPSTTTLTGEITLRGTVSPVGGIKEKVLGAHRAKMRKVILPWGNRREVELDVPAEVKKEVRCVFVKNVREAVEEAFGRGVVGWRRGSEVAMPTGEARGDDDSGGGRELRMLVESRL